MNMKRFVIFLTLTFSVSIGHAQWVQTGGPSGGTITAIAVLGSDVFAGTSSGVFRSTDGGASWNGATTGAQNASIVSLAVVDTDIFAATTTEILRSTNKGVTWAEADLGFAGYFSSLSALGSELFLVSDYDTVYRSSDLGATWNSIPTLTDSGVTSFVAMDAMFFAGTGVNGVLFSTDNGLTWSEAAGAGLPELYYSDIISLAAIGTNLFAATDTAIFLSADSGATWNALNTSFQGFEEGANLLTTIDSELFAGTEFGGLYFSTNAGKSWGQASSVISNLSVLAIAAFGTAIFAGTQSTGMFISSDGGSNWSADDSGIVISDINSFAVLGSDIFTNCFQEYYGNAGSLYSTNNNGNNWTDITSNLNSYSDITAIVASGGEVFAATDNDAVYVSADSGMTWNTSSNLGNLEITALFATPNNLFAATNSGMFQSPDGGTTWLSASSGIAAADITVLSFAQGPSALYCGSIDGAVYTSTDGGEIWNNVSPSGSFDSIEAITTVGRNVIAGGPEGLFLSSDNGMDWNDAFIQNFGITSLLTVGSNVFAGTTGGIFVSTNGGSTWNDQSQGLTTLSVNALAVQGSNLYAGTAAAGVWIRPLVQMINFNAVQASVTPSNFEQSYPNPFSHQTTIPFSLTQSEHVTITIFNAFGEQVAALADQDYGAGVHDVVWNAGSAPSGTYVCRITTAEGVQTESLVLVDE